MDALVKELPNSAEVTVNELLRSLVRQMFEADNDTSVLHATLETKDGLQNKLVFEIRIMSIDGVTTRAGESEAPHTAGAA